MATYNPFPVAFTGATSATGAQLDSDLTYISGKIITAKDWGAVGNAVADDSGAVQGMSIGSTSWRFTQSTGYNVTFFNIISNSMGRADRRSSPVNITTSNATSSAIINGSNTTVENLYVNNPAGVAGIQTTGTSTDIALRGVDLSAPAGSGILIQNANSHRWTIHGGFLNVSTYGVLFNVNAGGSKGIIVNSNFITSVNGDGINVNSPTTAIEDAAIFGNVVNVTAGSLVGGVGFAVALAHTNGASVMGNMSQRSELESHHVEDGSKNIAFIGNVSKACQNHGLNAIVDGVNSAQAKSLIVIGNTYEAPAITGTGYSGIHIAWTGSGAINGPTVIGNVVRNFDVGIYLGSLVQSVAEGNVIDNCTTAMEVDTRARVMGTNQVLGACSRLLYCGFSTANDVRVGKFICDTKPTAIIVKASPGVTRPGCSVEGFRWPQTNTLVNGANTVSLFATPTRMRGVLRVIAFNQSVPGDNVWYSTDIIYDGASITLANTISESNGNLAIAGAPAITNSGGNILIGYTATGGMTCSVEVEFDGIYML